MVSKEVIILGTGDSAQFCEWDCEVYAVNGAYNFKDGFKKGQIFGDCPNKFRLDKLFMADHLFGIEGAMNFDIDIMNSLSEEFGTEIISMYPMKIGKHVLKYKPYPYRHIVNKFKTDYFTDTICYMIAYALDKYTVPAINSDGVVRLELTEPLTIKLRGVDMSTKFEYLARKGWVQCWVFKAHTLGCEVSIAKGSSILQVLEGVAYNRPVKTKRKNVDPYGLLKGKEPPELNDAGKVIDETTNKDRG